jgi:hypothetical protein
VDARERRARLVTRHHLRGTATDPLEAARAVVVLHATDPATVYLSVLARCAGAALDDVATALYDERTLLRMLAMRRTLFVVPDELAATVHSAASLDVAAMMRRRLVKALAIGPTDPPLPPDIEGWLRETEAGVEKAIAELGVASGAQLARAEPRLQTAFLPRTDKSYDVRRAITSQVLVLMGTEGRLVRGRPLGSWTSRQHTWEAGPRGLREELDREEARAALVSAYLRAFGPATEADVAWWTGWPLGVTRSALAQVKTVELDGAVVLEDDTDPVAVPEPAAALLPALDPTPMAWKQRDWYLPDDARPLYDPYGNIGPTVWWGGEVVGGWAVAADGTVATRLLTDRGGEAARAVEAEAARLTRRLEGTVVVPSFRTPLERELSARPRCAVAGGRRAARRAAGAPPRRPAPGAP